MRLLFLDPFHTGSHRAFATGWQRHTQHDLELLTLPGRNWKWRMRSAAVEFARRVTAEDHATPDLLVTTDFTNVAELRGLLPSNWRAVPIVLYCHENQFTYPKRFDEPRDLHFAMTNVVSVLAADRVWFNSRFHRQAFFTVANEALQKFPPGFPVEEFRTAEHNKCDVQPPGIDIETSAAPASRGLRPAGPLHIVWASRWEYDKRPDRLLAAFVELDQRGCGFELSILGEAYRDQPPEFDAIRSRFGDRLRHFGYQDSRADYEAALRSGDVILSTADHEFFGIAIMEAVACGCVPLLPDRLAYPELFGEWPVCLYPTETALHDRLAEWCGLANAGKFVAGDLIETDAATTRYHWETRAAELDDAAEQVLNPTA